MLLSALAKHQSLRLDAKAARLLVLLDQVSSHTVPLSEIVDIGEMAPCDKPAEPFSYYEISSVGTFGRGEPYWIDEANIEPGSEEDRVLTKVDRGDIASPDSGTVLIPKVRPHLAKFGVVQSGDKAYYTTAFLQATPRGVSPELGRPRFDGHLDSKDGTTESRCER